MSLAVTAPRPGFGPGRKDVEGLASHHDQAPGPTLDQRFEGLGVRVTVPFYQQSLDFSCGPACLLMAMAAHDPGISLTREHEIDVWREANLIEIGATSRYGLALAAHRRGFEARVIGSVEGMAYMEAVRERITVNEPLMQLFFEDLQAKCRAVGVPEEVRPVAVSDIEAALMSGEVPIVLTDTRMFTPEEEVPHWVVVTGMVGDSLYVHNPLDEQHERDEIIALDRFLRGFGYGGDQLMVAVGSRRVNGRKR